MTIQQPSVNPSTLTPAEVSSYAEDADAFPYESPQITADASSKYNWFMHEAAVQEAEFNACN